MGQDIWGNPDNLDIHGNFNDRDIHGNRPRDIHGNEWDRPLIGPPSYGWTDSPGEVSSGSSYPRMIDDHGNPLPADDGRDENSRSGQVFFTPAVAILCLIGVAIFAVGAVCAILDARPYGIQPLQVLAAGFVIFLVSIFPKMTGLAAVVLGLLALREEGATSDGFALAAVSWQGLVMSGIVIGLGAALIVAALRPAATKRGHRALVAFVILPIVGITMILLVDRPSPTSASTITVVHAVVTASELNLRASPTTRATVVARLQRGDTVRLLGPEDGEWVPVAHAQRQGYVSSAYLSLVAARAEEGEPTP